MSQAVDNFFLYTIRMKIALIAPVFDTVPVKKYGGVEFVVYTLAQGLGKKGHHVDVFTTNDSPRNENYNLIPIAEKAIKNIPEIDSNEKSREVYTFLAISKAIHQLQQNNYDVIHNHADWEFLTFANLFQQPVITTHHNSLHYPFKKLAFDTYKHLPHISISNSQRKLYPDLHWIANIYNSINPSEFTYEEDVDDNMIYLARMSHNKGAIEAVTAALRTGKKIIVAARVDLNEQEYFSEFQKHLNNDVTNYVGEIENAAKQVYLSKAKCLIAPINWEEPFGLYYIEAMASGTPVITFARGSAPEIIKDGETGFLVNYSDEDKRGDWITKKTGMEGLCEAINTLYALPAAEYKELRRKSREHVEKNFTVDPMIHAYEQAYKSIL